MLALITNFLIIIFFFSCNAIEENKDTKKIKHEIVNYNSDSFTNAIMNLSDTGNAISGCDPTHFVYSDSTGILRGILVSFRYTTRSKTAGVIRVIDAENDTIDFSFDDSDIDYNSLSSGSCISVRYGAEIFRVTSEDSEDGPVGYEINRRFFVKEIK